MTRLTTRLQPFPAPERMAALLGSAALESGTERVLAGARLFLAWAALTAVLVDPTEPSRYVPVAYSVLAVYAGTATAVFAALRRREAVPRRVSVALHIGDLSLATVSTLFTQGPNSPFFLFFVFTLVAAAYRWGQAATLLTALTAVVLLAAEAVVVEPALQAYPGFVQGEYDLNRFIVRAAHLVIIGVVLGYLGEAKRRLRSQALVDAHLLRLARVSVSLKRTIQDLLSALATLSGAREVLFVARHVPSGRLARWRLGREAALEFVEFTSQPELDRRYGHVPPGVGWHAAAGARPLVLALDDRGANTIDVPWSWDEFQAAHACQSVLAASLRLDEDWHGVLLLIDIAAGGDRREAIHQLQRLATLVGPSAHNAYLLHRLRRRAGLGERARLARDLHDGLTQSLIGAEMQLDVLRRRAEAGEPATALAPEIGRLRALLRAEIVNLRERMGQMHAAGVQPRVLLEHLAEAVSRFQRETGIAARFWSDLAPGDVGLTSRAAGEVAQIVHEALVNIRKHSGASHALVSLTLANGSFRLLVEDDGRGILSGAAEPAGAPQVIRQRTAAIGGTIAVDSEPGQGTRLAVSFPAAAEAP